ncbi:hypothetical protein KKF34_08340 [Myxococcota bacterium]|nr:hypothetical protein [Myxococcota bacterium]MBU1379240.1 hypothetical protein [Myxococcota bacterium]MBU1496871.1 hypothetical protein [Myxococcota bacterium]
MSTFLFVACDDDGPPKDCEKFTTESSCLDAGCGAWIRVAGNATLDGTVCTNFESVYTYLCVASMEDDNTKPSSYIWVRDTATGREGIRLESNLSDLAGWTMCDMSGENDRLLRLQCVCPDFDPAVCDTFTNQEDCFAYGCSDFLPDEPRASYADGVCTEFDEGVSAPLCLMLLNGSGGQIDSGFYRSTVDGTEMVVLDFEGDYYGWSMCPHMGWTEDCICH